MGHSGLCRKILPYVGICWENSREHNFSGNDTSRGLQIQVRRFCQHNHIPFSVKMSAPPNPPTTPAIPRRRDLLTHLYIRFH